MGKQCGKETCCDSTADSTNCCHHHSTTPCIAVVSEHGEHLVVFDVAGTPRRFHHRRGLDLHTLCFHVHSSASSACEKDDDDTLLSPCFDAQGLHGEPEEPCFCGEEEPHIHAHLREECQKVTSSNHSKHHLPFARAVSQTLYPCHDDSPTLSQQTSHRGILHVSPSANMPIECNTLPKDQIAKVHAKVHQIQHGDHFDSLVHNKLTGRLHLQHEACGKCNGIDIHGTFDTIGIRNLPTSEGPHHQPLQIHFFAISQTKFNILDHFSHFFELHGDPRVQAAISTSPSREETLLTPVRSTIVCKGICCPAEVPLVRTLVESVPGVHQVKVNVPLKQVLIDHALETVTASQLVDHLSSLGSTLLRDGATERQAAGATLSVTSLLSIVPLPDTTGATSAMIMDRLSKRFPPDSVEGTIQEQDNDNDGTPTKLLSITYNPLTYTAQQIRAELASSGQWDCVVQQDGADLLLTKANNPDGAAAASPTVPRFPRPTVIVSGILWIVSMVSLVKEEWEFLKWFGLGAVAFGLPPIALKALRSLRRCRFDTNNLMFFASAGAIALQDFTEAAAVVFLFALSEWLEARATSRAREALAAIVDLQPETARLLRDDGQLLVAPASMVPVGSLVSVNAGDKIPCDGLVVEGTSTVDDSSLTGESRPIRKESGSLVSGGTVNSGLSPLTVRTTSTADTSAIARLVRLVEEAQANRSATETYVEKFAAVYTPLVVLSAILMCSIPWIWGPEVGQRWTYTGLVILVVACPCALIISTPVSYVAGLAATAANGVLIKGGAHLEALAQVKTICFDKTGTLTNGEFMLLELVEMKKDTFSRHQIFEYLCAVEEKASHPISQAIIKGAQNEGVTFPKHLEVKDHQILKGEGVQGNVNGLQVCVGNQRLFARLGLLKEENLKHAVTGYMSIEGHGIVCSFTAADGVRPETAAVIQGLERMKIEVVMLTGDNVASATDVANKVGIPCNKVNARLLPEEKLAYIEDLVGQNQKGSSICGSTLFRLGPQLVVMCGDGVNDAPALAAAHVGVAMGEGAALSMETADVTLLDSNLGKMEYSMRMGRRVTSKIVQNVIFSVVVKFIVLGFALTGQTQLWAAIGSDVGAMLIVTLNAMTLLPRRTNASLSKRSLHHATGKDVEGGERACCNDARSICGATSGRDECPATVACSDVVTHSCCPSSAKVSGQVDEETSQENDRSCSHHSACSHQHHEPCSNSTDPHQGHCCRETKSSEEERALAAVSSDVQAGCCSTGMIFD